MRDRSRHHPAPLPNGCGPFPSSLAPVAGIEPAVLPALTCGAPHREVVGIAPTHGNTGGPRAARSPSGRPLMFVARVNKGLTPARGTGGVRSTSPHKAFRPVRLSSSHTAAHAERLHHSAIARTPHPSRTHSCYFFLMGAPPRTCGRV